MECRVDDPLSCDQTKNEVCVFTNGQYKCECPVGISRLRCFGSAPLHFYRDGRCLLVNECAQPKNNECHKDANCIDRVFSVEETNGDLQEEGYTCECSAGFADISEDRVNKPGRICQSTVNECADPAK